MTAAPRSNELIREQRKHLRTRMRHSVEFSLADGRRTFGVCLNLGLGGMLVETAEPGAFNERVTVYMQLEGLEGETSLPGIIRWNRPGMMGIQFDSHGVRVTYALLRMLAGP
jgi:hypothetical protein